MGVINVQLFKITRRLLSTKIMKYLNVAEKNDAAKGIAQILSRGGSNRREGLSKYNKIYEFGGTVFNRPAQMVMTSVSGHLLNYAFHSSFRNWNTCDPVELFDAPIVKVCEDNYQSIKKTLEREIRSCDGLIIWTDCDREGENIGYEIIEVCKAIKPNISVHRAKFSEITAASIFRAVSNLEQPNKNVSDAVEVRQELDLRTGAAFTRLQTLRLQKVFPDKLDGKLISYGSCQFPTLGFVVDRYLSIENFISEPFWKIKMNHKLKDLTTEFTWKRDRLFDKNCCEAVLDICKESNLATVESIDSKSKNKWRPLPLDTIEFEKTVSKKLRINAKEAMKIAEKLYTQGFISYPRTETNIYPKELNLSNLVQLQADNNRWGVFARRILNEGGPTPRAGKKSDQAHPPIHPTKFAENLTGRDQQIYEFIVRHFLASVHKDAQGFETTVTVDIAREKFTAKGLVILEKNYLEVYVYEKWSGKEINNYSQGETFTPSTLELAEGNTSPPKLLTESDLIALMDKHGIGTDATHAEHIEKIKSREYVGLHEDTYFVPGILGMGLVEGYNNIGLEVSLAKPILRAQFENDLKLICDGIKSPDEVRREQIQKYKAVFQTVMDKIREIDKSLANRLEDRPQDMPENQAPNAQSTLLRPILKCPKCGNGDIFFRDKKDGHGKYLTCTAYPSCKNSSRFTQNFESIEVLNETCTICGPRVKKIKIKFKQNPFPGEPNPNVLCIGGCDENTLDALDIAISAVKRGLQQQNVSSINPPHDPPAPPGIQNIRTNNFEQNNRTNMTNVFEQNNRTNSNTTSRWTDANNTLGSMRPPNKRSSFDNAVNMNRNNSSSFNNRSNLGNDDPDNEIVCNCNVPTIQLVVKKDGPNKGRKFHKCANNACNFFIFAVEDNEASNFNASSNGFQNQNAGPSDSVNCNCNQPAVLRTVNKENHNKGRQFYACVKGMNDKCNFFQWADQAASGPSANNDDWGGGGGGWNGRNNDGGSTWNSGTKNNYKGKAQSSKKTKNDTVPYNKAKAKRKCGFCGEEGHTRNRCPNNPGNS